MQAGQDPGSWQFLLAASVMCLVIPSQQRRVILSLTPHMRNCERVETREWLNPGINDLQGEIKGTGALQNKEKIERKCCCKGEAENQTNLCWVGEVMDSECEKRGLVRCWESLQTVRAVKR